jgi:hypothetical protein
VRVLSSLPRGAGSLATSVPISFVARGLGSSPKRKGAIGRPCELSGCRVRTELITGIATSIYSRPDPGVAVTAQLCSAIGAVGLRSVGSLLSAIYCFPVGAPDGWNQYQFSSQTWRGAGYFRRSPPMSTGAGDAWPPRASVPYCEEARGCTIRRSQEASAQSRVLSSEAYAHGKVRVSSTVAARRQRTLFHATCLPSPARKFAAPPHRQRKAAVQDGLAALHLGHNNRRLDDNPHDASRGLLFCPLN